MKKVNARNANAPLGHKENLAAVQAEIKRLQAEAAAIKEAEKVAAQYWLTEKPTTFMVGRDMLVSIYSEAGRIHFSKMRNRGGALVPVSNVTCDLAEFQASGGIAALVAPAPAKAPRARKAA